MGAPIRHTCPDIDRAIKEINQAIVECMDIDGAGDIKYVLSSTILIFEDLRASNDALRKWGEDLEDNIENAMQEISDLENTNAVLIEEITELKQAANP